MNTIDSRDLYKKKCALETLRDAVTAARDELDEVGFPPGTMRSEIPEEFASLIKDLDDALDAFGDDEKDELAALEEVEYEVGISAFMHGTQLIPDEDFEDYARELAEDIGAISDDSKWPFTCIDWTQAAKELEADYSTVDYEGTTYFFRS